MTTYISKGKKGHHENSYGNSSYILLFYIHDQYEGTHRERERERQRQNI